MYKKSFINVTEIGLYVNLLSLSAFSWYDFKADVTKQRASTVAYTSIIITFILLVGVIIYHVYLLIRKDQPQGEEENEYPLIPVQSAKAEVTHSVIEIPKPCDKSPPSETISDRIELTPVYQ